MSDEAETVSAGNPLPKAEPLRSEPERFAAADGYAALRADLERRLSEARREWQQARHTAPKYTEGVYDGVRAVLAELIAADDRRMEVPHID